MQTQNVRKTISTEIEQKNPNEETVCQIKSSYKRFHEKTVEEEIQQKQKVKEIKKCPSVV